MKQLIKPIIFLLIVIVVVTACHTAKPAVPATPEGSGSEKLFASKWSLREVEGLTLMPTTVGGEAFLLFFPGQVSRVTGSTGCNNLKGTFELSAGGKMKLSPLATTKKMCPPDGNNTEQRFLAALAKVDGYSVTDSTLMLLNGTEVVARLAAAIADQSSGKQ